MDPIHNQESVVTSGIESPEKHAGGRKLPMNLLFQIYDESNLQGNQVQVEAIKRSGDIYMGGDLPRNDMMKHEDCDKKDHRPSLRKQAKGLDKDKCSKNTNMNETEDLAVMSQIAKGHDELLEFVAPIAYASTARGPSRSSKRSSNTKSSKTSGSKSNKSPKGSKSNKSPKGSKSKTAPTSHPTDPPVSPVPQVPTREPTRAPFTPPRPPTDPPVSPVPQVPTAPTAPPNGGPLVCGLPPVMRAELLTAIAEWVSGPITPGTLQGQALEWLIHSDRYLVCPDDPKAYQRYILALFYFSTDGDNWDECSAPDDYGDPDSIAAANDNCSITTTPIAGGSQNHSFKETTEGTDAWLTPVYECEWAGITCRVEGKCVDRIEFEGNALGGVLPYELKDLGDLRFLILERGTTAGTIPTEFGQIEDLLFLDLDFNRLTGRIPDEIYDLTGLFQLDLNDNFLTGTISPLIGNLDQLIFLQLAANDFTGDIPQELENLTNLLTGSFESTNLRGKIPDGLCDSLETKPTYILIADCNSQGGQPAKVQCDCCTDCFPL